jgi:hypothetical protein
LTSTESNHNDETNRSDNNSRKRIRDAAVIESFNNKKRRKEKSPCGVSINWQWSNNKETEVVVGARGIRQGNKPKSDQDYMNMTSRLSRASLVRLANQNDERSFREFKARQAHALYAENHSLVFGTSPFQGWLIGNCSSYFDIHYSGT